MYKRLIAAALALLALTASLASCGREAGGGQIPPLTGSQLPDTAAGSGEPETTEPETTEPRTTEPETTEPEATEPEVTEPEVTEPETTEPLDPSGEHGREDPPLPEVPPYNGVFDPAEYAEFLSDAIRKDIPLWGRFPFSAVFIYFPEIDASLKGWTVYIAQPSARNLTEMTAEDLVPLAQTLTLPEDIRFDAARPVYAGSGGGSGELEIIVELTGQDGTVYVSWDNFTWTNEDDALILVYRGQLSQERLSELREQEII